MNFMSTEARKAAEHIVGTMRLPCTLRVSDTGREEEVRINERDVDHVETKINIAFGLLGSSAVLHVPS